MVEHSFVLDRTPRPLSLVGGNCRQLKVLGEIALMLMVFGRSGVTAISADFEKILTTFRASVGRFRPPTEHPTSSLRFLLSMILAFEANGCDATKFRESVGQLLRQNLNNIRDQSPWSILSLTYFQALAGFPCNAPSDADLYNWSILRSRPPLHFLSTHDKYALSHLIFFLSDFGIRERFFLEQPDYDQLIDYLDELTASCLIEEDWDLVGEFLIGYECLGCSNSPVQNYTWQEYLRHQRPSGEIDVPRRIKEKSAAGRKAPVDPFEHYYHPTLVGIIASTLYLRNND